MILLDPIELLDILGNENRRRILQLLSFRPFYFNEMAKRLDVGPKAVIDHLSILERAGLIECYQNQGRRKYFRIARKTVLEVAVSPHSYGVREYRFEEAPKLETLELATDMKLLQSELGILEERRRELRKLIGEIEAREMEIMRLAAGALQSNAKDQLESEILVALLAGGSNSFDVANRLEVPEAVISDRLKRMKERGAVQLRGEKWSI
ncbi:MAG: helix-turn-helix domain-containing protein [Methanothrix sp.]|nr:helix-turn-helix domain-containing protein [Methanothrix sp.]